MMNRIIDVPWKGNGMNNEDIKHQDLLHGSKAFTFLIPSKKLFSVIRYLLIGLSSSSCPLWRYDLFAVVF